MLEAYLRGLLGQVIVYLGLGLLVAGWLLEFPPMMIISPVVLLVGGYMHYVSQQTTRLLSGDHGEVYPGSRKAVPERITQSYKGPRDLTLGEYQLYLVERYAIEKNNTLEKYVCDGRVFETLQAALEEADKMDRNPLPGSGLDQADTLGITRDEETGRFIVAGKSYDSFSRAARAAMDDQQRGK